MRVGVTWVIYLFSPTNEVTNTYWNALKLCQTRNLERKICTFDKKFTSKSKMEKESCFLALHSSEGFIIHRGGRETFSSISAFSPRVEEAEHYCRRRFKGVAVWYMQRVLLRSSGVWQCGLTRECKEQLISPNGFPSPDWRSEMMIVARHLLQVITEVLPSAAML